MSEQYPQQQPGAMLEIRPSFFPLAFLLFFFKPFYSINGSQPVQGRWKHNAVPVPSGRYQVAVWINYLFKSNMGLSSIVVDVPPGAAATVTWYAPFTIWGKGRIAVAGVGPMGGGQPQQSQPQQGYAQQSQPQQGYAQQGPPQQSQPQQHEHSAQAIGGWHPDPTGRHQVRYYDGTRWTEHVGDNGTQATDPIS